MSEKPCGNYEQICKSIALDVSTLDFSTIGDEDKLEDDIDKAFEILSLLGAYASRANEITVQEFNRVSELYFEIIQDLKLHDVKLYVFKSDIDPKVLTDLNIDPSRKFIIYVNPEEHSIKCLLNMLIADFNWNVDYSTDERLHELLHEHCVDSKSKKVGVVGKVINWLRGFIS